MIIEGASRKCIERLYVIFRVGEIEVSKSDEDLYDVVIPSKFETTFHYFSKYNTIQMGLYRQGKELPEYTDLYTTEFVRVNIS